MRCSVLSLQRKQWLSSEHAPMRRQPRVSLGAIQIQSAFNYASPGLLAPGRGNLHVNLPSANFLRKCQEYGTLSRFRRSCIEPTGSQKMGGNGREPCLADETQEEVARKVSARRLQPSSEVMHWIDCGVQRVPTQCAE